MTKKLWFKAKTYGYGWYPCSWEGWTVILVFLVLVSLPYAVVGNTGPQNMSEAMFVAIFIPYIIVITSALIFISVKKGEKAQWRWGGKKNN